MWHHDHMLTGGTRRSYQVRVDSDPWNPGEPVGREDERPCVAVLARHARVHKDVLQLARPAAALRSHRQARPAKTQPQIDAGLEMRSAPVVAAGAAGHVKARFQ